MTICLTNLLSKSSPRQMEQTHFLSS